MEILGFVGAIIGLIAALINRKQIVVVRGENESDAWSSSSSALHSYSPTRKREPVTVKKRLKRFLLAIVVMVFLSCCGAGFEGASGPRPPGSSIVMQVLAWPMLACMMVAAYQLIAAILTLFVRMWS